MPWHAPAHTPALALALILAGSVPACGTENPARPETIDLGGEVTLAPGQAAVNRERGLEVRFLEVTEDSRCPADVTCIWAGEVVLRLSLKASTKDPEERDVKERETTTFAGLQIKVLRVEPAPVSTRKIAADEYRATLRLAAP